MVNGLKFAIQYICMTYVYLTLLHVGLLVLATTGLNNERVLLVDITRCLFEYIIIITGFHTLMNITFLNIFQDPKSQFPSSIHY